MTAISRGIRGIRKPLGGQASLIGYSGSGKAGGAPQALNMAQISMALLANGITGQSGTQGAAPILWQGSAPAHDNSTGQAGSVAYDSSYIYVCIATNTWKRIAWTAGSW